MRAVLVVVANILREQAFQVAFVNCNDVIQEITPATPYPTLCDSILPRTLERGADRTHAQGSNCCGDFQSILGITIKDEEPWSGSKGKCFSQLLNDPHACRMLCDIEVQDAPTIVTELRISRCPFHPTRDRSSVTIVGASCTSMSQSIRQACGSFSSCEKHFHLNPLQGSSSLIVMPSMDWKSPQRFDP